MFKWSGLMCMVRLKKEMYWEKGGRIEYSVCACVRDAACFRSVNVCIHVFRQSRAVLRIVTLHALLQPPPHPTHSFLSTLSHFQMSAVLPPPFFFFWPFLSSFPLVSHMLSYSSQAIPVLTAAINLYISLSSYSVSRACKGNPFCATLLCPSGLLSSHALFILQVTTLCRWSISTSRGSSASTSYRLTSLL